MPQSEQKRREWELRRAKILLLAGLFGMFTYFILVELFGVPWHLEWELGFLSMMGLGLFQAVDKR
jgi:hypothetical protein